MMRRAFVRAGRVLLTAGLVALGCGYAVAAEPVGCDKFKWPVARERAALTSSDIAKVNSGQSVSLREPGVAVSLALTPSDQATLPRTPERPPAAGTYSGFVTIDPGSKGGVYSVSLASGAWIDAVQGDRFLKPVAFSGVTGCEGIRKIVRFDVAGQPLLLQITGTSADRIAFAVFAVSE